VRLPRASSQAYRQFKQQQGDDQEEQQANGAEAEAQQQPEQAAPSPQEAAAAPQAGGQAAQLAAVLNDIKTRDSGGVLEAGPGGTSLRWVAAVGSPHCVASSLLHDGPRLPERANGLSSGQACSCLHALAAFAAQAPSGHPRMPVYIFDAHVTNSCLLPCCPTSSCSKLISQVQAGQLNASTAIRAVRALCDSAIFSNWHGKRKDAAQAASDLLDEANEMLAEFEEAAAAQPAAPPPPPPPEPKPEPRRAAPPQLPPETFFLSAEAVRECLTLNIDSSILVQRRGGWPAGRKRKPDGTSGLGGLLGRRQGSETSVLVHRVCGWHACPLPSNCLPPLAASLPSRDCRQAQGAARLQPLVAGAAAAACHCAVRGAQVCWGFWLPFCTQNSFFACSAIVPNYTIMIKANPGLSCPFDASRSPAVQWAHLTRTARGRDGGAPAGEPGRHLFPFPQLLHHGCVRCALLCKVWA